MIKLADIACSLLANIIVIATVPFSKVYKWCVRRVRERGKKNILVYSCDLLGDNIIRMPFFLALRNRFPKEQYHISAVLTRSMGNFLSKLDIFDEIIEDGILNDRHPIFWLFERKRFVCGAIRWAFRNDVDILIWTLRMRSMGCDFIQRLSSPRASIAYSSDDTKLMFPMAGRMQQRFYDGKYYLLLPSRMGYCLLDDLNVMYQKLANTKEQLDVESTGEYLRAYLEKVDVAGLPKEYIVFVPGAGASIRQWPTHRFAELADRLGGDFVIVGAAGEKGLGDEIKAASKTNVRFVNLCGETSLEQLGVVLSKASLIVTNETGTATYAAMIGAPTVCILGGGDFGAFFPNSYCPNAISVFHRDECFNCGWKCKKADLNGPVVAPCIESITVDDVLAAAVI